MFVIKSGCIKAFMAYKVDQCPGIAFVPPGQSTVIGEEVVRAAEYVSATNYGGAFIMSVSQYRFNQVKIHLITSLPK